MTDLASRDWRLVGEEPWDGPTNMALDEVAARTAAEGGPRTLRVYRWEPSTLSLGYHQEPDAVDWTACAERDVTVTRRQTGGGAIYHDSHADVSYSVVAPADELPGDLLESYRLLLEPVFDALDRVGVDARIVESSRPAVFDPACYLRDLHPAHDVVAADGRKLSGNAQHRQRSAVVQHGSLSVATRPERHLAVFADCDVSPDDFASRVTSVREQSGADRETTVAALEDALREWADADDGAWTDDELAAARDLADRKYASDDWTRRRRA